MEINKNSMKCCKNIWIDYNHGDDINGDGTYEKPFKSEERALKSIDDKSGYVMFNSRDTKCY